MRISVVTISYNQAAFLRECIDSVLSQNHPDVEYIVVDPGSTDGSRAIADSYGHRIVTVFEADCGPADGLNKGFARASGTVLCYLNADDTLLPGALSKAAVFFEQHPGIGVVRGHAWVIDDNGRPRRRVFSDSFSLSAVSYGACTSVQPSTLFRSEAFTRTHGFNVENRSNWDDELLVDMVLAGAKVATMNEFLSCYRVHRDSITGSGRMAAAHREHTTRMFQRIRGRPFEHRDFAMALTYRILKHVRHPQATAERLRRGPMFGSA